jgi:hypothetical protein
MVFGDPQENAEEEKVGGVLGTIGQTRKNHRSDYTFERTRERGLQKAIRYYRKANLELESGEQTHSGKQAGSRQVNPIPRNAGSVMARNYHHFCFGRLGKDSGPKRGHISALR